MTHQLTTKENEMKTISMEVQDLRNSGDADMLSMVQVSVEVERTGKGYLLCLQNDGDGILGVSRASGDQSEELAGALCVAFFDLIDHPEFAPNMTAAQRLFDAYLDADRASVSLASPRTGTAVAGGPILCQYRHRNGHALTD